MVLFSLLVLLILPFTFCMPTGNMLSDSESENMLGDWPPFPRVRYRGNKYNFTSHELLELKEYFEDRLSLTKANWESKFMQEAAFETVLQDDYGLGVNFCLDYLSSQKGIRFYFRRARDLSKRHIMKLLAMNHGDEMRNHRELIYISKLWSDEHATDEEIIDELNFLITEVAPLIGTPYDRHLKNRLTDPDPADKDYETDSSLDEEAGYYAEYEEIYDAERVKGITVAEARDLLYYSVRLKRFGVTRWLIDNLNAPNDPGCFLKPRWIKRRSIYDHSNRPLYDASDFEVSYEYEPRPLFRELLSRSTPRTMKILHHTLTRKSCPREIRTKVLDLFRDKDEYSDKIDEVFSSCKRGRKLLSLVRTSKKSQ